MVVADGTALNSWLDDQKDEQRKAQAENPAAPAGAQQMAKAAPDSKLGAWLADNSPQGGYVGGSQGWLTGANTQGTNNGWDNQFVDKFVTDWGQALENGEARDYFAKPDATGVVTWDHLSTDGTKSYSFGDVYENGHRTGNLYDMYSRDEANLMIAPFILDSKTQAETFSASDRTDRLDREVQSQRESRNQNFENSLKALEFEGDVKKREQAFKEGFGDEATVLGATAGGAGLGAGIASVVGPLGTLAGAGIGGAVGFVGGMLNRDSLTEQAARAYETTAMSKDQFGLGAGIATGINQWAGFGMREIAPLSNLTQGSYDWLAGDVGDGTSEFYRTDKAGKNKAPIWMRGLDVAATVGDSLVQFSSPMGLAMYSGAMGSTIAGEVGELALTGGNTFDPRRGGFDNIFTDEKGHFDMSAAAAGIGKIGIDVVQMGMIRGLAGKTNALRATAGEDAAFPTMTARIKDRLPLWAGGNRGLARDAEGKLLEERVTHVGFSMTKGADGKIVEGSMRPTLGILAPSEQLQALSARIVGMRQAALNKGAYSADDFYHAAHHIATGEARVTTALVNAMGEGYEEAFQAVLEPHSHGGAIDGGDVAQAALYGAASGAGMGAGMGMRTPSAVDQQYAMAALAHYVAYGELLDRKTFDKMSKLEQRSAASMSKAAQETARAAFAKAEYEQHSSGIESVAGYAKVNDAIESAKASDLARASSATDHAFVIAQQEQAPELDADGNPAHGEIPMEGVSGSARQIAALLSQHVRGMEDVLQAALNEQKTLDAAQTDRLDVLARRIATVRLTMAWAQRFSDLIAPVLERIDTAPTVPILEAYVADLNETLRQAYHREIVDVAGEQLSDEDKNALARAVSLVFVRDPQDQAGSYQMLLPQVSARLSAARADNVLEISHAVLTPISGDYDGDKIRQQAKLVFDDAEFARARGGGHFIGAAGKVNIATPKFEPYLIDRMAEAMSPRSSDTLRNFAQETLNTIASAVRTRYDGVVPDVDLDEVLEQFFDHVKANDKDARAVLLDGLAKVASGPINRLGQERLTNEWLWLDQLLVSTMQRFQESYASHRTTKVDTSLSKIEPIKQSKDKRARRALKRAVMGQTLAASLPGESLFRMFQDLHYSSLGAAVLSAGRTERTTLTEQAEIYRELGQMVTRTDLEQLGTKDDIVGRVFTQLNALAKSFRDNAPGGTEYSQAEAMLVIANVSVQDLDLQVDGTATETDHNISLAQMLLKFSVIQDKREKAAILDRSPELQARHARLLNMTRTNSRDYPNGAEDAFVEVFGSHQMYELLGDQATMFSHLTLEQFVREYASYSELERRDTTRKLQQDAAYLGRKQTKDMPYTLSEAEKGEVSAYRSIVDALIKVGNGRVSMDLDTGKLSGEYVRRSNSVSQNLHGIHADVRQAMRQFLALPGNGRLEKETEQQAMARMLETRPEVNTAVMNLIPRKAVPGAFTRGPNGTVTPANWLYEFLTADTAEAAEMIYWRNLLYSQWKALSIRQNDEGVVEGDHAREFARLNRRMHRIMYGLAQRNDNGMLLAEFEQQLYNSRSLEDFIKWVNTTPGVRVEGAPIVAWVDDVAEFDADKAKGGWTTILEGAALRESIATLRQRTQGLTDQLAEEQVAMANDVRVSAAVRRVLRKDAGEEVQLEAGDREMHDRMVQALKLAEDWAVALGPNAMVNQTLGAIRGFYGKAHNKGINPENVEPLGSLDAMVDALDYTTGYERALSALTAVNMDAVGSNFSHAVKDAGRSMDDHGRQVTWEKPTLEQMLDWFDSAETRPMARAMLFPQVLDIDANNVLRPQLLFGKSLSDMLQGVGLGEMFKVNGSLSTEAAMKYGSMVSARAREFGGHHAFERQASVLAIARTSAADHVLNETEEHRMVVESYRDNAEVLQAVGVLANVDPEMLARVKTTVKKALRVNRVMQILGAENEDELTTLTQTLRDQKVLEVGDAVAALEAMAESDPANEQMYHDQITAAEAELDAFEAQLDQLMSDDAVTDAVQTFGMASQPGAAAKDAVLDYIRTHLTVIERIPSVRLTLNKLTQQLIDGKLNGQVYLEAAEWDALSNAVIGAHLDDVLHSNSGAGTISPWPDGDAVQVQKYYDTSWSSLADDLLDLDSPLVRAATEVARVHMEDPLTESELIELLDRTVLNSKKLGPWTSDFVGAVTEAHARINAAAAAPAIAMVGNAPKRLAAILAATERTTQKPDEALLSTVKLSTIDLSRDPFDEVDMTLPAQGAVKRPLAQLNGRFAKSVTMQYVDADGNPQTSDLMSMVGNEWMRDPGVRDSGYKAIHLDRIKAAVDRNAGLLGISPSQAIVTVEFFHPDSQPDAAGWYNNVYFEGTAFKIDSDGYGSLAGALWFSPNGLVQMGSRKALDASKTGKPALDVVPATAASVRAGYETDWTLDFAGMLRAKAEHLLKIDVLGLDAADFYNAIYKDLKLRHFVRLTQEDGTEVLWTAEQVIAWQAAHPGEQLTGAELYIPSDDALRTMLGEQGTQGVLRPPDEDFEIDPASVDSYQGVNDTMAALLSNSSAGETVNLEHTRLVHRGRQSQMRVDIRLTPAQVSAFEAKMQFFNDRKNNIYADRQELPRFDDKGFNPERNMAELVRQAGDMIRAEDMTLLWAQIGLPFGPRAVETTKVSEELLKSAHSTVNSEGYRTGWIYEHGAKGQPISGTLDQRSLMDPARDAYRVAPGDLVLVKLDSFDGDLDEATKALDRLRDTGATIILSDSNARADMRAHLAEHLRGNNYEYVLGSKHTFRPIEYSSRYQNPRARLSDLTATHTITRHNRIALFAIQGREVQEGGAWVNPFNERLGAISAQSNLVPTSAFAGFNVPATPDEIEDVRAKVFALNTVDGRRLLKDMAHGKEADRAELDDEFDLKFDHLIDWLTENPGTILPPANGDTIFGIGDFLPLLDNHGRILFYRHGMVAPRRDQIDVMAELPFKGEPESQKVAVYPSKREPAATVHTGYVRAFRPRPGYGLEVELDVPLQMFGNKAQLEWNGMKYVLSPWPSSLVLPEHGIFTNLGIDMVSDLPSLLSKEATADTVDNHSFAFAVFGIDFLSDVTEFFFPGRGQETEAQSKAREILRYFTTKGERLPVKQADSIIQLLNPSSTTINSQYRAIAALVPNVDPSWVTRLENPQSNEAKITLAMLTYLMTPGARVDHVLRSGGFNNDDSDNPENRSRLMPKLFTQLFDNAEIDSDLRVEINKRLNQQLHNPNGDGTGYILNQDFTFESIPTEGGKRLSGYLMFPEVHASGDNPVKNGMSFDDGDTQGYSVHSAAIAYGALGVETARTAGLDKTQAVAKFNDITKDMADGGMWRTLNDVPTDDKTFRHWHSSTPAESARRGLAREAMTGGRQEITKDAENGWSEPEKLEYDKLAVQIVQFMNLEASQKLLVDFWVRQMQGSAHGRDAKGIEQGRIHGAAAIQEAKEILWAVQNHYLPVVGAEVPLLHLHDLQSIYRANRGRTDGWFPRDSIDKKAAPVTTWQGWTEVALGTALTSDNRFDPLFLLWLDGLMHTYQSATRSLMELPVSLDAYKSLQLLDPQFNHMLVSLSTDINELAKNPMVLDAAQATIAEVLGGKRIEGRLHAEVAPASEIAKKRKAIRKWRRENGVPVPVDVSMKNFRRNGVEFVNEGTTTNALIRGLIQLRLGTALINPMLYVSMGPEQWIRGALDRAANTLTGQATVGLGSMAMAKRGWTRYTPEDLQELRSAYQVLGSRNDFKAMLYADLGFKSPHGPGGRIMRALETYGRFGTAMQDPTYGMKADTLARRYLEGVLQHILATPTLQVIGVQDLARQMKTNPTWVQDHMPDAHQAGLNAVAQLRSLKNTTLNHFIKGIVDPMAESRNPGVNIMSNLLLKVPLFFSTYATNVATTILGLQGVDQMTAAFLHGRSKGLIGRFQALMRGDELPDDADMKFDMADVMEGVDLSRAFIRGGLTHTALFAFGMWAAGLGLSGEDDEMRRRRLLARAQGVGNIYDPRRIENDFRNADALYLDVLPFGIGNLFEADPETGRAMYQMNWALRQFVSPVIGMEKFFETGDFRHVTWGFEDAMGSFPLINTMMFDDVVHTAGMLTADADKKARSGEQDDLVESMGLMTRAVGTYERMLFENSFVNQIYIGRDRYDRDPYIIPLTDSDGTIQRDVEGQARPQNLALDTFYDPDTGKLRRGYYNRDQSSIDAHVLSENRATFAFVTSMFTGGIGDSDYWRYNMGVKTREFEKAPVSLKEVTDLYQAGQGTTQPGIAFDQKTVTVDEVLPQVRNHLYEIGKKQGHFYTDEEIWSAARTAAASINAQAAQHGTGGSATALSTIEADGHEKPTLAGAKALMLGLYYGSIKYEDAAMRGFYVTAEQRDQIAHDFGKELIQEGVDLGLDKTRAVSRMKRIMYGPFDNPSVGGLSDIIYAPEEKISWSKKAEYAQLNTTYVVGPDGRPWATGFARDSLMSALGLKPAQRQVRPEHGATMLDSRMNVADLAAGLNTGLRGLEPLDSTRNIPTDVELEKRLEKAIEDAVKADYTPFDKKDDSGSGGGRKYGGGSGGGGGAYFSKMYALPGNVSPYGNSVPFINTSNPIIRRTTVRRERVWSERGRLNQWQ